MECGNPADRRRQKSILIVDEHQIDVGAEIQFLTPKLTEANDGKILRQGSLDSFGNLLISESEDGFHHCVGQR